MTKAEVHELSIELAEQGMTCAASEYCEHESAVDCIAAAFEPRIAELTERVREETRITGETSDGYHTFNELYEHRHALFAAVCAAFGGWKSKLHSDGTMFDGWFIAGIGTPIGQATYHLPISWWDTFDCYEYERAPEWDGHTPQDVVTRIRALAKRKAVP